MKKSYKNFFDIAESHLSCSAHHLDHVERVFKNAVLLASYFENVDEDILYPAVILHDIARVLESEDKTGKTDHAILGGEMAKKIVADMGYSKEDQEKIAHCIYAHRFRTGIKAETIEAMILHDADKLDVLGAIGVARVFMISGKYGQRLKIDKLKNENVSENGRIRDLAKHNPLIEYKYKMKKIPDKMYLDISRKIGQEKFNFTKLFFETLEMEMEECIDE